VPAPVGRGAL